MPPTVSEERKDRPLGSRHTPSLTAASPDPALSWHTCPRTKEDTDTHGDSGGRASRKWDVSGHTQERIPPSVSNFTHDETPPPQETRFILRVVSQQHTIQTFHELG